MSSLPGDLAHPANHGGLVTDPIAESSADMKLAPPARLGNSPSGRNNIINTSAMSVEQELVVEEVDLDGSESQPFRDRS